MTRGSYENFRREHRHPIHRRPSFYEVFCSLLPSLIPKAIAARLAPCRHAPLIGRYIEPLLQPADDDHASPRPPSLVKRASRYEANPMSPEARKATLSLSLEHGAATRNVSEVASALGIDDPNEEAMHPPRSLLLDPPGRTSPLISILPRASHAFPPSFHELLTPSLSPSTPLPDPPGKLAAERKRVRLQVQGFFQTYQHEFILRHGRTLLDEDKAEELRAERASDSKKGGKTPGRSKNGGRRLSRFVTRNELLKYADEVQAKKEETEDKKKIGAGDLITGQAMAKVLGPLQDMLGQ